MDRVQSSKALIIGLLIIFSGSAAFAAPTSQETLKPIPVFAYYYIWFNPDSWDRAKSDYPTLGRYSSDDRDVMQQHILWAKDAGIDGFIVSWKSTETLNSRLAQLVELAEIEDFKLMIIYQGLTFERESRSYNTVASDFDYFIEQYSSREVFNVLGKPLIIWNGIMDYKKSDVESITSSRREDLLILATAKNVEEYQSVAKFVDGNAYYWSSVNPDTYPGYLNKLANMGYVVHVNSGIWISPAAPGYDGRLVGGSRVIERQDGMMLRHQMETTIKSSPDVIGLISWNEFSENTHIEPSENYGMKYLEVLTSIINVEFPELSHTPQSAPSPTVELETPVSPEMETPTPAATVGVLAQETSVATEVGLIETEVSVAIENGDLDEFEELEIPEMLEFDSSSDPIEPLSLDGLARVLTSKFSALLFLASLVVVSSVILILRKITGR